MENGQADAGRDGRTRLARPNHQAQNGDREIFIFLVQLTTSRIGNHTLLIHTLPYVMTIHTSWLTTRYAYSIQNQLGPKTRQNPRQVRSPRAHRKFIRVKTMSSGISILLILLQESTRRNTVDIYRYLFFVNQYCSKLSLSPVPCPLPPCTWYLVCVCPATGEGLHQGQAGRRGPKARWHPGEQ